MKVQQICVLGLTAQDFDSCLNRLANSNRLIVHTQCACLIASSIGTSEDFAFGRGSVILVTSIWAWKCHTGFFRVFLCQPAFSRSAVVMSCAVM